MKAKTIHLGLASMLLAAMASFIPVLYLQREPREAAFGLRVMERGDILVKNSGEPMVFLFAEDATKQSLVIRLVPAEPKEELERAGREALLGEGWAALEGLLYPVGAPMGLFFVRLLGLGAGEDKTVQPPNFIDGRISSLLFDYTTEK